MSTEREQHIEQELNTWHENIKLPYELRQLLDLSRTTIHHLREENEGLQKKLDAKILLINNGWEEERYALQEKVIELEQHINLQPPLKIVNPGYRIWNTANAHLPFIRQINIGDTIIYRSHQTMGMMGYVEAITRRGVNINAGHGDTFVKWTNVAEVHKKGSSGA